MICVSYNYYILHSNNSFTMLSDILILHTLHTYIPTHTHTHTYTLTFVVTFILSYMKYCNFHIVTIL